MSCRWRVIAPWWPTAERQHLCERAGWLNGWCLCAFQWCLQTALWTGCQVHTLCTSVWSSASFWWRSSSPSACWSPFTSTTTRPLRPASSSSRWDHNISQSWIFRSDLFSGFFIAAFKSLVRFSWDISQLWIMNFRVQTKQKNVKSLEEGSVSSVPSVMRWCSRS